MSEKIIVNIATQSKRRNGLIRRVEELAPQCDILHIFATQKEIFDSNDSELMDALNKKNVAVNFTLKDYTSNAKFYFADKVKGFYLTCDDDIIYPPNYVEKIIEQVEAYGRKKIVSFQGGRFQHPINNYYWDRFMYDYRFTVYQDEVVDLGGTGVMCFHTDAIKLSINDFPIPCATDLQLSVAAKKQGVEIVALKHTNFFLFPDLEYKDQRGIRDTYKNDCSKQTELANKYFPK